MYWYQTSMSIYIHHMNWTQWTMWPGALVYMYPTLLGYAPDQICLPHCTHIPLHFYCSLHIDPKVLHNFHQISIHCNIYLPYYFKNMCQPQICPSNAICPYYLICIHGGSMPIYIPHMNTVVSSMWQGVLYIDDNDADNAERLHKVFWPLATSTKKRKKMERKKTLALNGSARLRQLICIFGLRWSEDNLENQY